MKIKGILQRFVINHVSTKKRAELLKKWYKIPMGERCEVYKNVVFGSEPYLVSIGDDVRITAGVKFCTHDGGMWVIRNLGYDQDADLFGPIWVGNNVHIGWNAVIMPNVTIGSNVVIGVGAVVTHDIPSNSVAVGVPARVVRSIDEYYEKNKTRIVKTKHLSGREKEDYLKKLYSGFAGKENEE